jgi:hypothetical protein
MMARHEFTILNSTGTIEVTSLNFGRADVADTVTLRIANTGTASTTLTNLHAIRADFMAVSQPGQDADDIESMGADLINGAMIEARLSPAGPWTPLNETALLLALGPIAASSYVAVDVRVNIPDGSSLTGPLNFALCLRSL